MITRHGFEYGKALLVFSVCLLLFSRDFGSNIGPQMPRYSVGYVVNQWGVGCQPHSLPGCEQCVRRKVNPALLCPLTTGHRQTQHRVVTGKLKISKTNQAITARVQDTLA